MFEDKPRKIVYIEKKDEVGLWCRKEEYYACPECGNRYDWADRTREGNRQYFCSGCGNFLSWAKLDYENHKETDTSFDKGMAFWQFLQDLRYGHTWENEVSMTYSHSEKEILEGCLALMKGLVSEFAEYLEWVGFEPDTEEERFSLSMPYAEIVCRLFLWHTSHSGGTSTGMKCRNLGITEHSALFEIPFKRDEEENNEEEEVLKICDDEIKSAKKREFMMHWAKKAWCLSELLMGTMTGGIGPSKNFIDCVFAGDRTVKITYDYPETCGLSDVVYHVIDPHKIRTDEIIFSENGRIMMNGDPFPDKIKEEWKGWTMPEIKEFEEEYRKAWQQREGERK